MAEIPAVLREVDEDDIPEMVEQLLDSFNAGRTREKSFRIQQLKNLLRMLDEKEDEITEAGFRDLGRNRQETIFFELFSIKGEIIDAINNLAEWMKPEHVKKDLANVINTLCIVPEPFGVVCVFSAWNYPVLELLQPLAGAIAAGNTVLLKPSDLAIHTSNLMMDLIPQYLDTDCYKVAAGGIPLCQAVLKERFDYIMFTGSPGIGKIIMRAAAENLTPVTLELGGKNPCIVDSSANIKVAGKRIAWGKYTNAGQSCLAPNYILCHQSIRDDLVASITAAVRQFYGENPRESNNYGRIINTRHFDRVHALLDGSGNVVLKGESDRNDLYIAPTIITDVKPDDTIMQDEIFGPILPIICIDDIDDAIDLINDGEKPLALYAFTSDKSVKEKLTTRTSSGAISFNDVLVHFSEH
ncbi:aldehyde dehydrogenase, dimeric NADP-preferring-like isoform X2 [Dysidea avara]|uniref:aldehyde dehydrogenase, dimeric NADP-preferring-like isoform X2 n=1 Tax=Dysidea avara TaxID=196820 RepID=UPI003317F8AC